MKKKKGKIGTFSCWLFGHLMRVRPPEEQTADQEVSVRSNYCRRCGISREELT